jgi:hypothetical protein
MTDLASSDPPPDPLQPSTIADLLGATAVTVEAELRGLGDVAGWRPAPGEWSASECVGHLIEAERRGFAGRIRTIIGGVRPDGSFTPPLLETWDPPAVAAARHDESRPPAELADEFVALRAASLDLVGPSNRRISVASGSTRRSASSASTSFSASGSITTVTTSARCWR